MKRYELLVKPLFFVVLSLSLGSLVFTQKTALPPGLTENSSLVEILNWLDKTSLAQARIGLNAVALGLEPDEIPTTATRYSEWAIFSKGFKLAKIDGCKITFRNDDVKLISFSTKYPNPAEGSLDDFRKATDSQSRYVAELFIPLQELRVKKAPYRHAKKGDQAELLGTWRTEFKKKSEFFLIPSRKKLKSLLDNLMKIEIVGVGQEGRDDSMDGGTLTFTFNDKSTSESFDAAFRQAITLCKDK